MENLVIGVGRVAANLPYARTLKDRRNALKSLVQRLRNAGFSVTEFGGGNDPRFAIIGFAFAGHQIGYVDKALDEAFELIESEVEVTEHERDVFDYADTETEEVAQYGTGQS